MQWEKSIYYGDLGRAYLYLGKDKRVVEVLEKVVMTSSAVAFNGVSIKEP